MWKKAAALLCCLVMMMQMTVLPARADEPVYFVAADIEVQPVTDETMPFWSGGYLYVPGNIFTGTIRRTLGVTFQYVESEETAVMYSDGGSQYLLMDLNRNYTVDHEDRISYPGALMRNGIVYVPAFLVSKFFGLDYSVIEVSQGHLVWIRQQNFGLTDREFADAASYRIASCYAEYIKTQKVEPVPPVPPEVGVEIDGKKIYLCMLAGDDAALMLDALGRYNTQAAFFCTPEFMSQQGDLLRRMAATGQSIGILVDGENTTMTIEEQLESGNQALEDATCGRTRLCRIQNATEQTLQTAQAAGYRCLEPDVNYAAYFLRNSSHAASLLERVSNRRGDTSIWLEDRASIIGLRAFLAATEDAEGRCLAWTETA